MEYTGQLRDLIPSNVLNPLGPGSPNESFRPALAAVTAESLFPGKEIVDKSAARNCLAGIWLLHDFLDESHAISPGYRNG